MPTGAAPAQLARYRAVLNPLFRPRALAWLMPSIQENAAALVDAVAAKGQCKAVGEIARRLATQTLLTLLGFPDGSLETLLRLLARQAEFPRSAPFEADLVEYVSQAISTAGPPGIIAALRDEFEEVEILSFVLLLFGAAIETTTAGIGFALFELPPTRSYGHCSSGTPIRSEHSSTRWCACTRRSAIARASPWRRSPLAG
ncbi:hypothetical protein [Mycobacterium parascrofulaceum]|uniref:hypothetical protein n=1 Tax=Mycobacterium parascrofulaceum TaxID=240125 RepID=UPI001427BA4B|nr:hypothetical protein [Mycobacterium parascrofulaceum]